MRISLTNWQLLAIAIIINIVVTSIGVFLSNLNFLSLESVVNQTKQSAETQRQFQLIQIAHERTTRAIENGTKTIGVVLTSLNETQKGIVETQKNIAELTNDVFIMQKAELEQRKTLGEFLAIISVNSNITIPEDLKKRLLIEDSQPQASAPNY